MPSTSICTPKYAPANQIAVSWYASGIAIVISNVTGINASTSTRVRAMLCRSIAEPAQVNCDHCHHTNRATMNARAVPPADGCRLIIDAI
ncbi:unannotated protein [freshwater metagenome]|uniref:Unannotated protein n=1 Tax=freshwater metagenome TaxID=449393 RepID=A0A6J6ZUP8_9ZZZZ